MRQLITAFLLITSTILDGAGYISIGNTPATLIRANPSSGLDHTEGVAFTPSGDYLAAANALVNTITFYKRIDGAIYETTPSFSISGSISGLNYPHDLHFSPDGTHLAVANRGGQTITIYRKSGNENCFDPTPIATIGGELSQITAPSAVAYSPVENIIVVANMHADILTFYSYQGDHYDNRPYQVIEGPFLTIPDGIAFASDGKLLAVTSHHSHSVVLFQGMGDGRYSDHPVQVLQGAETLFCYPHSVAFHPLNHYLAVSNSHGRKNVLLYKKESEKLYSNAPELSLEILDMYDESTIAFLHRLQQEGGVKGIAFAPDGKSLATTQNFAHDSFGLPEPMGVVAIYPVSVNP